jgi:lysophospholipase L1-like esterase
LCKHCGECGHIQRDCPAHKEETARKEYGDYFHEIIEGRNTRDNSSLDDETERKDISGQADSNPTTDDNNSVNVLLGASNCKRLGKVSQNGINASISGATLENIDETIKLAKSNVFDKTVDKVVISFGTNDITKAKGEHDQVNINLTHAIHQVKSNFPNSIVGICTILPRKGKGPSIIKCNDTVLNINIFLKKLCIREQIEYVDAYELFTKQGHVVKSLFDNTDSSGVHISVEGCTKIREK